MCELLLKPAQINLNDSRHNGIYNYKQKKEKCLGSSKAPFLFLSATHPGSVSLLI